MSVAITNVGNMIKIDTGDGKSQYFENYSIPSILQIDPVSLLVTALNGSIALFQKPLSEVSINGSVPANLAAFEAAVSALVHGFIFNKIDPFVAIGFATTPTSNVRRIVALGNNSDVDTAAPEDIWSGGGLYPWMTTATSLEVVSDSANDTAAGTGARGVLINGLLGTYEESAQIVALNGLTPVAIPAQLLRIQTSAPTTAGSFGTNQGNITIRDAGGGTTRAIIPAGYGITRQSQYTVPLGYTLQIVSFLLCINRATAATDATIATYSKTATGPYRLPLEISIGNLPYRHDGLPGISFAEKTDFGLRATHVSANNMDITAAFLGILMKNDLVSTITY